MIRFAALLLLLMGPGGAAAQSEPAEYLGDEVCAACHEDLLAAYRQTRHAKLFGAKAPHLAGVQKHPVEAPRGHGHQGKGQPRHTALGGACGCHFRGPP